MTRILLIDDDPDQLSILSGFLKKSGYLVSCAENGIQGLEEFKKKDFSLIITDLKMPEMTGDRLIYEINRINPLVKKIMITAYAEVKTAVEVMKSGADDFIEKPVNLDDLIEKIKNLEAEFKRDKKASEINFSIDSKNLPVEIKGESTELKDVVLKAGRVAKKDWTVLLRGETGTGKELFAELIHLSSSRRKNPFVEINCAAIPENLFESEIFGHKKGSFTGADKDKPGMAEAADKGILFLDEIGEMPLIIQAKLLKFIQNGKFQKIGENNPCYSDVRIIAATNRNLEQMVKKGLFREDLYYRLSVLDITIPSLKQRKTDIPLLAGHFLEKYSGGQFSFDASAIDSLTKYSFPGNVRELEHIVQKVIAFASSDIISKNDLPDNIRFADTAESSQLKTKVADLEKEMIIKALEKNRGNQSKAADKLGISERVLRYKMKSYNIKNSLK
ncbi:MAG: sigma-54-dependent transcriptional regulator [Thermotogota bacterium]